MFGCMASLVVACHAARSMMRTACAPHRVGRRSHREICDWSKRNVAATRFGGQCGRRPMGGGPLLVPARGSFSGGSLPVAGFPHNSQCRIRWCMDRATARSYIISDPKWYFVMSETAIPKQHGFKPGQSGNPAGRPKGARHRTTVAIEALLDGEGEAITRKAIEAAKAGDMVAIRLVLDRICPPRKTRPIHIELPSVQDAPGVAEAQQEVLRAACAGELLLDEAQALSGLLEARRQSLETQELEARLSELEASARRCR